LPTFVFARQERVIAVYRVSSGALGMTDKLRAAVIGVGHFGRYHAAKYAAIDDVELVAVVDHDHERATAVANEHGCRPATDIDEIIGDVDLVSVAAPTSLHRAVACRFLERGIHTLVEKPIADSLESADAMIEAAARSGAILQVGHIERFSSAFEAIAKRLVRPLYIESYRIAPFNPRIRDVNVILDLMIHDIDLILALVQAPLISVDAVGAPVITRQEDIANTRLKFANGCVANITASRVSAKTERTMRIFQPESYTVVDFQDRKLVHMTKGGQGMFPGFPGIKRTDEEFEAGDTLEREIRSFVEAVRTGGAPVVDGVAGRNALEAALRIGESLREHLRLVSMDMPS
jgi:predicted dehydrogenase